MGRPIFVDGQWQRLVGLGSQQLTVSTSVVSLTVPAGTVLRATLRSGGQPIRVRWSGTNPTATAGLYLLKDEEMVIGADPADVRLIRDTTATGDATVEIEYEGFPS